MKKWNDPAVLIWSLLMAVSLPLPTFYGIGFFTLPLLGYLILLVDPFALGLLLFGAPQLAVYGYGLVLISRIAISHTAGLGSLGKLFWSLGALACLSGVTFLPLYGGAIVCASGNRAGNLYEVLSNWR